jgi:DNA polymerase-3 subunit delta
MPAPGPAPLTLVTGPEALLRDRAVATAVAAVRAADPEADVTDVSAVGIEAGRITELASPSLFGGTTVIVVRDVAEAVEPVADELRRVVADPGDDVVLVLVHAGGVKGRALLDTVRKAGAVVVECKPVKWESDKVAFVQGEFTAAGRRVAPAAAVALVDALGSDLRELAQACSQLVSDTRGTVDVEVVERYHSGRVEVTGFKVADAAVEGRYEDALRLLRHALATGVDPVPLNAAFAAGLRTLARVGGASRSARPDDIARDLGLAPFQVRKARGQLAGWTPDGVAAGILAVARADEQIKGGGTDPVYALERAVGAIVSARTG